MATLLMIDDEERLRQLTARLLRLEGYEVLEAGDAKQAMAMLGKHVSIQLVLCDVKLPDANGVELTARIKQAYPHLEVIVFTAFGNIADGVQAMKNGAFDYLVKGDDNGRIIPLLQRALEKQQLSERVEQLERQIADKRPSFSTVIGQSKILQAALALARTVAPANTTVLLTGETGTGKEVFAQAIHAASPRAGQAFVAVNAAAVSRDLLESELFGHAKGAFTGALKDRKGFFEAANGGTLFLDELGEMPLELQARLLRVLETGELVRVGETQARKVDVRLIAATNRLLPTEVSAGRFREDLYYRLNIFEISLPPLRERKEDLPLLAHFFVQQLAAKLAKPAPPLAPGFVEALQKHRWPGNIRELRNVLERAVLLAGDGPLSAALLPPEIQQGSAQADTLLLADAEKQHIAVVMRQTGGNKTETARLLGIALTTLYRKLDEYGI